RRKPLIATETPDGLAVLLEPVAASRGQLAGNVDDQLRGHQKRKQHIVSQAEIGLERRPAGHARGEIAQVFDVCAKLRETLHEERHRRMASSLMRRIRCSHGSRSAARNSVSRTKA